MTESILQIRRHTLSLKIITKILPQALAATYGKLCKAGETVYPVGHGISWAIYFNDPDGIGVEVYWDTRETAHGVERWQGFERVLDVERLYSS